MGNSYKAKYLDRTVVMLHHIEDGILVALLSLMIGMAAVQILSRNILGAGIVWGDMLVRILVLWVGLMGAMVATRNDKHIQIDIINRFLPAGAKSIVDGIVKLFSAAVCAVVAYYSLQFVVAEFHDGGLAFWKVPSWLCEAIIPISLTIIGLRYLLMAIDSILKMFKLRS
jgi:TRAP-type C4-dicarboxylate transport system permease small subunit